MPTRAERPLAAADMAMRSPPIASNSNSYGQILRSTATIGGSSLLTIAFSIVRVKAIALMLGPAGVGLFGVYSAILELAQAVGGLGVSSSAVREIAEAAGSHGSRRIAIMAAIVRRLSLVLGIVGAALLALFAAPIAQTSFGDTAHQGGVVLLAIALLLRIVSQGEMAILQGLRRINDLAQVNILAALFGTIASLPLVFFFGIDGVAPALVVVTASAAVVAWCYSRRLGLVRARLNLREVRPETAALMKLGATFMASAILTLGAAYVVRIIVVREIDFEAAGLYQAAWALGGLYAGFVLQAMGTDFYPRLTAICRDRVACNRLVNEQARVSLLLAGPGVTGTMTLAPLVMTVFYSAEFAPAADLLRWLCFGMMLRIVAWPMGYVVMAMGLKRIFFWTEVAATVVHVGLAWWLVRLIGLEGAGMAFFGLYVWHAVVIYLVVRRVSGFRWTGQNLALGSAFVAISALVFCG